MLADVIKLLQDRRSVFMHGVGNLAEMRNDLVVAMAEITARQHRGRVYRNRFDHDHRRAADGALLVVTAMALARQAELRHVGGMCTEDDTIIQPAMA